MTQWLEMAQQACAQAGYSAKKIEVLKTWDQKHAENAVFLVDEDWCLKIYGPPFDWRFPTERLVLEDWSGLSKHPTPKIGFTGVLATGSPFLFQQQVKGGPMDEIWPDLDHETRLTLAAELGAQLAAIHQGSSVNLQRQEERLGMRNKTTIMREAGQRSREVITAARQLPIVQREILLTFLQEEAPPLLAGEPALTHSDLSHHHVFIAEDEATWHISGILDWADAVVGPPEWDWVCLWHWTFNGVWQSEPGSDWEAMQVCLQAYFGSPILPERFASRCLAA